MVRGFKMRYVLKEVGKSPQVCSAGPGGLSLEEAQALVGGYIEAVNICLPQVNAICNEDGSYLQRRRYVRWSQWRASGGELVWPIRQLPGHGL